MTLQDKTITTIIIYKTAKKYGHTYDRMNKFDPRMEELWNHLCGHPTLCGIICVALIIVVLHNTLPNTSAMIMMTKTVSFPKIRVVLVTDHRKMFWRDLQFSMRKHNSNMV